MYRFLLTPRWWGINVFTVLAVPFCLFMGSWQLSRFEARADAHEAAEHPPARAAVAVPLRDVLPTHRTAVRQDTSGRTVTATGYYDLERQLLVPDRSLDGEQGFYVLTMLRMDGGAALPVVRGWLPGAASTMDVPAPEKDEITVTGALQAPEDKGTTGLRAGQIGRIGAAGLINVVPYDVYAGWITVQEAAAPLRPVPPSAPPNTGLDLKAFQNLGYTGEWFVFAGFVVFMWFRFFRREVETLRDAELGLVL